jgi:hypothetical protein
MTEGVWIEANVSSCALTAAGRPKTTPAARTTGRQDIPTRALNRLLSGVLLPTGFSAMTSVRGCVMKQSFVVALLALASCRSYDLSSRLTSQRGLIPADQYARYGREQAQEIAIAREFGHASRGTSPEDLMSQADSASSYARALPDVAEVKADPLGLLLTIRFKSGWRTMTTPIKNGKRGAETTGLPGGAGARTTR